MAIRLVCSKCGYLCPTGRGNDKDFFKEKDGTVICLWCKYYTKSGSLIRKSEEEYQNAYRASIGLPPVIKKKEKEKGKKNGKTSN